MKPWLGWPAAAEPKYPEMWPRLLMPVSRLKVASLGSPRVPNEYPARPVTGTAVTAAARPDATGPDVAAGDDGLAAGLNTRTRAAPRTTTATPAAMTIQVRFARVMAPRCHSHGGEAGLRSARTAISWQSGGVTAARRSPAAAGEDETARVRDETVRRLERSMGALGTAAMASMDSRLPWFRAMSAENRSWLGLVAQAGVAAFVDWVKHPERDRPAVAGEVFGTAPRELARAVSLQQTVEMARVIIDVVEAQVDELAAPGGEAELREAVLRYTREIAFGAAQVYARTAEARGAWDARLEALVVDSLVRGEVDEGLQSWASALNWSAGPVAVIAGMADGSEPEGLIDELRIIARRARLDLLAGVHGHRLVVVLGGTDDPVEAARQFAGRFGAGPGRGRPGRRRPAVGHPVGRAALAGLRAAAAWPDAPRPVEAGDLLPERALDGDEQARAQLIEEVYEPLLARRHRAARHRDDLPGAGQLAGGDRAAAVRAPEHGALPAAPGHRADRPWFPATAGAASRSGSPWSSAGCRTTGHSL